MRSVVLYARRHRVSRSDNLKVHCNKRYCIESEICFQRCDCGLEIRGSYETRFCENVMVRLYILNLTARNGVSDMGYWSSWIDISWIV